MGAVMNLAESTYKSINGVLSGPAGMHFRPYFIKFTAKFWGCHFCSFHFL